MQIQFAATVDKASAEQLLALETKLGSLPEPVAAALRLGVSMLPEGWAARLSAQGTFSLDPASPAPTSLTISITPVRQAA